MLSLVWAESESVTATDRGLSYGDGLFETIRVHDQQPVLGARHLARLLYGAERLGIPLAAAELGASLEQALARYAGPDDWVLKLVLTRGVGGRGYVPPSACQPTLIISRHDLPPPPDPSGVSVQLARHPVVANSALAGLKTLNRLDQVIAGSELRSGNYEVLLTDGRGHLLEGSRTNILAKVAGEWWLPPMSELAVHGVMLAEVVERLRAAGETVRERVLPVSILVRTELEGMFLTNSVVGVIPVCRVDCRDLPIEHSLATICRPLISLK
ncbi:aminotransferase class IV [Marinobacter zhejiangensis]|uniref:4-amino-4-deoxychorismate lyase n=1 Tax=Marinobacter zhejiangensis TaxID=488535 RepID=A0A1I4NWD6_9GAMM|nr:aminotransferase class IV [Marinobacter zhejiangensis]SFM19838.1 4-amino-4-deoxychorismate lyase [Marinobacter zhejiangensis]